MNATVSNDRTSVLLLTAALLVGFILRCWNINQSFWWDELWSTLPFAKAHSVWQIFTSLGYYFNNHLLYSLLARGSMKILGEGELAARLPALVMGLLGIAAVFQFGKAFLGVPCGIIASFLLVVSPFHIDHSSEARGYAGLALFSILSSFYFLKGVKTNGPRTWVLYVCFTVLGFCSQVFMVAVSMSQCIAALLSMVALRRSWWKVESTSRALRNVFVALLCAGVMTILIYAPVLPAFLNNLGKVRLLTVNRMPFVINLVSGSLFPGMLSFPGSITYGVLLCLGSYALFRKDAVLFAYLLILFIVPLSLYLLMNPMFVFDRYFIFALPFFLLVLSAGMWRIGWHVKGVARAGCVFALFMIIIYLQLPSLGKVLFQDRQNYREAVQYVEGAGGEETDALVFSLGYAGEHFRYYARRISIATPQTLDELYHLIEGKKHVWCLVTAWLPELRPPYEDEALYAEPPGQVEIYNYVKRHFMLKKRFHSKYGVDIYYGEDLIR